MERGEVADGELFVLVPDPVLDSAQATRVAALRTWQGTLDVSIVRVADSARALLAEGRMLGLRLSARARTIGRVDRVTDHCSISEPGCDPPQRYASGLVLAENAAAHFSLLLAAAGMVGNVSRGGFLYWVQPIGGGLHAVSERSWCELDIRED